MTTRLFYYLGALIFCLQAQASDTLNPCLKWQTFHIVVLGSSTAAGAGPSSSDSTWVNRYRKYVQGINTQNTVTNLAQGGTTTYQIMPDWYTAPVGRPSTNTARNVSEAIRLNADAIIINMPSNDAANGFSLNEQMHNFTLMAAVADSAGIPVWVCTTQPRSFNPVKVQLQKDVRDSVFSYFGIYALDFWNPFADTTGQIDSLYDSGDGVHMNDAAHKILFEKVAAKNILSQLVDTLQATDVAISASWLQSSMCGSLTDSIFIAVSNNGLSSTYNLPIKWTIRSIDSASTRYVYDTLYGGVASCAFLQKGIRLSTQKGGEWKISAELLVQNDSILSNNFSDTLTLRTTGLPNISALNDSICKNDSTHLSAAGGDTIVWYDANDSIVGFGPYYRTGALSQNTTYKASAVKGGLFFQESLFTRSSTSTNFNGIMFDLVAKTDLEIDSLALKVQSTGKLVVHGYFRNGSKNGFEDSAQAWTSWGYDTVHVVQAETFHNVSLGAMSLQMGDTLGVYLSMQSGSNLQYQSSSSEQVYTNSSIEIISGTGKAFNFGASYYPRLWAGEVFYHHGFNPRGLCASDTVIQVVVNPTDLNLGNDTTLTFKQSVLLQLPKGASQIVWSTGDTTQQLLVDSASFGVGSHLIFVQAEDKFGCSISDSILITISKNGVALQEFKTSFFEIYPNPAKDYVNIEIGQNDSAELKIYNSLGALVLEKILSGGLNRLEVDFASALYLIEVNSEETLQRFQLVVE